MDASAAVALVSPDELLAARIRGALAVDAVTVIDMAATVATLGDGAAEAHAVVIAGYSTADRQRAVIRNAIERFPPLPVIVVASLTANGVRKVLDAGASGVVLGTEIENALTATVRAVRAAQLVVPHRLRQAVRPPLSHREKQTLALLASGLTNREIAARLYLAESTVKTHIASIFGKLGVGSRSEATALVADPDNKLGMGSLLLARAANGDEPVHAR